MRSTLGGGAIAVLAVVCCAGLPMVATAGLSAAALGLMGGLAAGLVALLLAIVAIRVRAARRAACPVPVRSAKEVS